MDTDIHAIHANIEQFYLCHVKSNQWAISGQYPCCHADTHMNNHVYSTLHARKKNEGRKEKEKYVDQRKEHGTYIYIVPFQRPPQSLNE